MNHPVLTFNAGEVSPYLRHRIDYEKTPASCETMENFLCLPYGPVVKRPGLRHIAAVEDSGENSRFLPFVASTGDRYLLHFTEDLLTIYRPDGTVADALAFLDGHTWTSGDWDNNLRAIQIVQLNDIAFLVHPATHPLRLSRLGDTNWHLEYIPFTKPPVLDENTDTGTTYAVVSNPVPAAWALSATYITGNTCITTSEWECVNGHTATADNQPGTGKDWRTVWKRKIFAPEEPVTLIAADVTGTAWTMLYHNYYAGQVYGLGGDVGICLQDVTGETAFAPEDAPTGAPWGLVGVWEDDYIPAIPTVALNAYRTANTDSTIYRCILSHAPYSIGPDSEPGVGASWETCWEASGSTLPGTIPLWFASDGYAVNDERIHNGRKYRCTTAHTPDTDNEPGTGADWSDYWFRIDAFLDPVTTITGNCPGRYYRLAPERTQGDLQIELAALQSKDGVVTDPILVSGAWDCFTYGTWSGTFFVERSIDLGQTWTIARSYQATGDRNIADAGDEDPPALLRLRFQKQSGTATTGDQRAVLIPRTATVPGYILIDEYESATRLYGKAVTAIMSGSTHRWSPGAFSDINGFPRAIALHDGRLVFAGTEANPVSLWFSQTNDFLDFETGIEDDQGIFATLALSNSSPIRWIASQRRLFVGTALGEWAIGSESSDSPLSPTNFIARQWAAYGSAPVAPLIANDAVFFAERKGVRLRELSYFADREGYDAADLTRLAEHITRGGIASMAWQQTREPGLWLIRRDGTLLHFGYARAERFAAWTRHTTTGGTFTDVAILPSDSGDDEVFFIIDRAGTSYLERFPQHWLDAQETNDGWFHLDGVSGTGAGAAVTLPAYLKNTPVKNLNPTTLATTTPTYSANPTIANGTPYHIGLPIPSAMISLPIDFSGDSTMAKTKRLHRVSLSLYQSRGGTISNLADTSAQTIPNTQPALTLRSGWEDCIPDPGHRQEIQLRLQHSDPFPFTLRAACLRLEVTGR